MRISGICLLLPILVLAVLSCSESDDGTTEPDPSLPFPYLTPTASTMQIDTTHLTSDAGALAARGLCHALSGLVVFWIDANIAFRLAIPIGALSACLLRTPVYLGEQTWRWTATGGMGNEAHTDELTARVLGDGVVEWSMRVSGTRHDLDHFLWFEGMADTTAHAGDWHFYDVASPAEPKETIRIDWTTEQVPGGLTSLQIESTDPSSEYFGDILRYETIGTSSSLVLADRQADSTLTTTISWDRVIGNGMTVNAQGDTCCWAPADEQYADIPCP